MNFLIIFICIIKHQKVLYGTELNNIIDKKSDIACFQYFYYNIEIKLLLYYNMFLILFAINHNNI